MPVIFARVENQQVVSVGCAPSLPPGADVHLLQEVPDHAEWCWVKWSLRHRRTLHDPAPALNHPFAIYFTNAARLKRLLGDEDALALAAEKNAAFLKFHSENPHVLATMKARALAEKDKGREVFSAQALENIFRWSAADVDRGDDPEFKLCAKWTPYYSRVLQMDEPRLLGFFTLRASIADDLIWIDSRSWRDFAAEHKDDLKWSDPYADIVDSNPDWRFPA